MIPTVPTEPVNAFPIAADLVTVNRWTVDTWWAGARGITKVCVITAAVTILVGWLPLSIIGGLLLAAVTKNPNAITAVAVCGPGLAIIVVILAISRVR